MVLVSAYHEIDTVLVEQRHPLLADPEVCAIELVSRRDGDLVHAHHDPVDIMITTGSGQLLFQPGLLSALRIAPDVRITTVLVRDIVIGKAYRDHRAHGECVPKPAGYIRLTGCLRHREVGLIGLIPDRSIAEFVLVVAGRGHPGTVAGAAAVVLPEIPPGPYPIFGHIGVAEITVEQVKQWLQPLHAKRRSGSCRRAKIVVHIWRFLDRYTLGGLVPLAQGRRGLIPKAGEREPRAAARSGSERAELRRSTLVGYPVQISGVGPQLADFRMRGVDNLAGLGVGVTGLRSLDHALELAIESPEHHTWVANGLQRVPGHHHL